MGWAAEKFEDPPQTDTKNSPTNSAERTFEIGAEQAWARLRDGFDRDVEQINARNGDADIKHLSDQQIRISSAATKIAVVVTADPSAHTIQYIYEPEDATTAVPERGLLTMRESRGGIELYSADEHLSPEQARRLILDPLFIGGAALEPTGT
jgi:hypothetical protein